MLQSPFRILILLSFFTMIGMGGLGCSNKTESQQDLSIKAKPAQEPQKKAGGPITMVDATAMDPITSPCSDFFQYACGGWIANTQLPEDKATLTRSFTAMRDQNAETLKGVLESYAAGNHVPAVTDSKKLGDIYASCMDEAAIEKSTPAALQNGLRSIWTLKNKDALPELIALLHRQGVGVLFSPESGQNDKDATQVIAILDRGSLSLPDREYLVSQDAKKVKLRAQLFDHMVRMLKLAGASEEQATREASTNLDIETRLAQAQLSKVDRRDPNKIYNPIQGNQLLDATTGSNFNWTKYSKALGFESLVDTKTLINLREPAYFKALNEVIGSTPIDEIRAYLKWRWITSYAAQLSQDYVTENFAFYGTTLNGQKKLEPRWKRCTALAESAMGETLGQAYLKAIGFGEENKKDVASMLKNIRDSLTATLKTLDWMDDATKNAAYKKLSTLNQKIAYPDKWKTTDALSVDRTSHVANVARINDYAFQESLSLIGKPVNRDRWEMYPQTVNAYYNPNMNEIVFPAGILQSPFYSAKAAPGANFGAIGMVIGHEITHGYDDEGRQFDEVGNLNDWWSAESSKKFKERAQCLINQYNQYVVGGDTHLNGELTLGENIADLGGLKLSYSAFDLSRKNRTPAPPTAGLTEDQQFFVAFAQGWCTKSTPELERVRAETDPHSAPKYRVNGVVVNTPEFAKTFGCKLGDPMAPQNRCQVW